MRRLKTILTVLLAILWLPVTSHCLLFESAAGFDLLSCCTHTEAPSDTDHHEDDCAKDSCTIVEGAQYKSSLQRLTIPPFVALVAFEFPPLLADTRLLTRIHSWQTDDALGCLPGTWQFSARTALPARAPSFVS